MKKLSVEAKLGLDLFHTDEENSHIDVDLECTDEEEIRNSFWPVRQNAISTLMESSASHILDALSAEPAESFLMTRLLKAGNIHMVKSVYLSDKVDRP